MALSWEDGCGVRVSWETANDNTGIRGYQIYRSVAGQPFDEVGQATGVTYCDGAVAAELDYTYYVRAVDTSGNVGWRNGTRTVKAQIISDTERPDPPRALRSQGAIGNSPPNLWWVASGDNVGVTGYIVYDASTRLEAGRTVGTWIELDGLAAGEHSYFVKAFDAAGNTSWRSNVATIEVG